MLAMLARRLALVAFLCALFLVALEQIDRPEQPLVVTKSPALATQLGGGAIEALLRSPLPEIPAISRPSPYLIDGSTLVQVLCGDYSGTAIYLGSGRYVTAAHVVTEERSGEPMECRIAGQRVTIEKMDLKIDYALIRAAHYPPFRAMISCECIREGETYFATGYADGNPWIVTTRLIGTAEHEHDGIGVGTADVNGSIVAGMSGGGVANRDGAMLALNDWNDGDGVPVAGVVELADTPLCAKGKR